MNLFILAAGTGSRLYPLTKDRPKSLIELNDGSTILERQVSVALESGAFDHVYIITGYLSHMIEERLGQYPEGRVSAIFNPYFEVSNNLFSLWTAHYLMPGEDFVISNGDNIYRPGIYEKVFAQASECTIQVTVDAKDEYDDDDMKVLLDEQGHVARISKQIPVEEAHRESLGLVLVRGEQQRQLFHSELMKLVRDPDMMQRFWLEIFNSMIAGGAKLDICDVPADAWAEIDFHPDIKLLQAAITANLFD